MPKTTDQIRVGANSNILTAPVGTSLPANIGAAFPAGWTNAGFTEENGFKVRDTKEIIDIPVAQLFYPARKIVGSRNFELEFILRQYDAVTVPLAFGGGDVTEDASGMFRYTPPPPEDIDERALAAEFLDGDFTYRFIVPRGLVSNNVESEFKRTAAADLPITFGVIGEDGEDPWIILTDDPSFEDIVGS